MKRARLIYNPKSGREQLTDHLADLLAVYERAGYETSAFRTTAEPLSAMHEATRAAKAGFDLIIAAGGDGTVSEVVNGVSHLEHRPMLAIIPGGTSNDYAHALGIPRNDLIEAAHVIEKNPPIPMDIGYVETGEHSQYFVNIAAMGNLSELTYEVSAELKSTFGYLAYLAKGAEKLPRATDVAMKITYDGGEYDGPVFLVFVALTNTFAGFNYVAPDKVPGDGLFTLIIVKSANVIEIGNLLVKLLKGGQYVDDEKIIYRKTSQVTIKSQDGALPLNLDGDFGGHLPANFTNLKQHLSFFGDWQKITDSIAPRDDQSKQLKQDFIEKVEDYDTTEN